MRHRRYITRSIVAVSVVLTWAGSAMGEVTPKELLDAVGIKPKDGRRGQMDVVGFVTTAEQMDSVLSQCGLYPRPSGPGVEPALRAAVCPHDDYYYAARLYSLLVPRIHAKTVILFGVFHKARAFDCRDKLVFDSFREWRGPYGPVRVSAVREAILAELPRDDFIVDDDMQTVEHSVEAIVPWLQAFDRDVEIVSILVPYMNWETMDRLAADLSRALDEVMRSNGWRLGDDVALVSSTDAVHYGDAGWGGSRYADFGCDAAGYEKAVARDEQLAETTLCGTIEPEKLERFLYTCVNRDDVTDYRLTWCGRFSVPFGLDVAARVSKELEGRTLEGTLLGYGTSVGEASLDLDAVPGLGATAPNNLHHWVGYAAIGYR